MPKPPLLVLTEDQSFFDRLRSGLGRFFSLVRSSGMAEASGHLTVKPALCLFDAAYCGLKRSEIRKFFVKTASPVPVKIVLTADGSSENESWYLLGAHACAARSIGAAALKALLLRLLPLPDPAPRETPESETLLNLVMDNSADFIALIDKKLCFRFSSPSWSRLLSLSQPPSPGAPLLHIIHPSDRKPLEDSLLELLEPGAENGFTKEVRVIEKGGKSRWMECRVRQVTMAEPAGGSFILSFRSIDSRKEAALIFKKILQTLSLAPCPVEIMDLSGKVQFVNNAHQACFGYLHRELLGKLSLIFSSGANLPDKHQILREAQKTGSWSRKVLIGRKSGEMFWDRVTLVPIRDENRRLTDFVCYHQDLTDELRAQEELDRREQTILFQSRQALMGELLNMVAHQWRQPLTVIASTAGHLELRQTQGVMDEDFLKTKLRRIIQTVEFLSQTIESFRNFYSPAKSRFPEDLSRLIDQTLELMSGSLSSRSIEVEWQNPGPVYALVYPGEMVQVFMEILNNARDAFDNTEVQDKRVCIRLWAEDDRVELEITNNAGMIPPEILPRIFQAYFTTKNRTQGTGLGLYMAKTIVCDHHEGEIEARSREAWTSFRLSIPRKLPHG